MPLAARLDNYFDAEARRSRRKHRLRLRFADSLEDLRAAQRLRHRVFVEEMGARLPLTEPGIESDRFDHYCQHLLVWDEDTDQAVGCYRILTDSQAVRAGGFYAQTEFDLTRVLAVPGRMVEVGRTCVHPDYRNGAVIGLLWSGLARFMLMHRYDYLMGCASIPLTGRIEQVGAIWQTVAASHLSPPEWRVFPKTPFAALRPPRTAGVQNTQEQSFCPETAPGTPAELPPLIKGYLRLGAQVCGEPAWDPAFNVADLFLLLSLDRLSVRYTQHFIRQPGMAGMQSAKPPVNEASFTGQTQEQLFCNRK
ncbi:MAG: putative hemolysin [Proteobacteria bacterium]|nr:putative hemolysin [Pseudomonadota bacterium]